MKKLLCVLLCAAMLCCTLSTAAFAAQPEKSEMTFAFADIAAPVIGQSPSYHASYGGVGYVLDSTNYNSNFYQNGVGWYNVTAGENVLPSEPFRAGQVYRVSIFFAAQEGYSFAENVEIQINSVDATVHYINPSLVIGELEFPSLTCEIDSAFAYVDGPAEGMKPSYVVMHGGPGYVPDSGNNNPNYYQNGVGWYDITDDKNLRPTASFEAGHEYKVMLFFSAEEGYFFAEDIAFKINGDVATVTHLSETSIMVEQTFTRLPGGEPCNGGADCPSARFADIHAEDWFHEAVDYAVKNGLFGGMSETTFEPNTAMTRAMLVTVLWRYAGQPREGTNSFADVPEYEWYAEAVAWAAHNVIVGGVGDNRFDPNGNITREQMATILYRYASKTLDTSARADLSVFPDADSVSDYAKDAVSWAVAEGLINGSDGKLLPQGNATRAQVAAILMRFIKNS